MHIKRWLLLLLFGVCLMGLGIAYVLREAYLQRSTLPGVFYYLTLQFIPRWGRGVLFMGSRSPPLAIAIWKLNESLLYAFVRPTATDRTCSRRSTTSAS